MMTFLCHVYIASVNIYESVKFVFFLLTIKFRLQT